MKKKLYIFGTGQSALMVEGCLRTENVDIAGYLDNNKNKCGQLLRGKPVFLPEDIPDRDFAYIIIASVWYVGITSQLLRLGVEDVRIIRFFDYENVEYERYREILDIANWKLEAFKQFFQVRVLQKLSVYCTNLPYEIADGIKKDKYRFPIIKTAEEAVERIIREKCSVCRFGDGEFEIIAGKERAKFQKTEEGLGKRLKEVLNNRDEDVLTCIANNYGSLAEYDEDVAMGIRLYMKPGTRAFHMSVIDLEKVYYDAYLSRPYIIYKDKEPAKWRFEQLKRIWEGRKTVVIEGGGTRMGYGNDLLAGAESVERILCPDKNAWSQYDAIFHTAAAMEKDRVILIALGPTATVLAYDLAKEGFQAVDIGHLDNEYEWFLKGAKKRFDIPYKCVNEYAGGEEAQDIHSEWYENQVIADLNRPIIK